MMEYEIIETTFGFKKKTIIISQIVIHFHRKSRHLDRAALRPIIRTSLLKVKDIAVMPL